MDVQPDEGDGDTVGTVDPVEPVDLTEADPDGDGAERADPGLVALLRPWAQEADAPIVVLSLAVIGWIVVMGQLILQRQQHMTTLDFDEGIYDQMLWQLAHFRTFDTVRGVTAQGHHASFAFLLLLPLVWLGGGVGTWDVLQTIAVACTAFPLFFLTRDRIGRPWVACAVGVVWLGQPTVQWFVHEGFHPEVMAIPFLVGTFLFGQRLIAERAAGAITRRSVWGFAACFALTITWKEDLCLAMIGMGLIWAIRRHWWLARWIIGVSALWFVVFGMVLVPHFAGGSVYGGIYDLGSTPAEIASNSVHHPSRVLHKLDQNDAVGYARDLSSPYGFVPLLSPITLLITAPQWFINIISASNFTWALDNHYQAVPMAALGLGLAEGLRVAYRRRLWVGQAAVVLAIALALVSSRWYGPSPMGIRYRTGIWPLTADADLGVKRYAIDRIPGGDGVSASYLLVAQLTHRQVIYTFPNPWRSSYYGVTPDAIGDPGKVDWLLVDTDQLDDRNRGLLASIRASGEFEPVIDQDTIVLLRRVAAPGRGSAPVVDPPG